MHVAGFASACCKLMVERTKRVTPPNCTCSKRVEVKPQNGVHVRYMQTVVPKPVYQQTLILCQMSSTCTIACYTFSTRKCAFPLIQHPATCLQFDIDCAIQAPYNQYEDELLSTKPATKSARLGPNSRNPVIAAVPHAANDHCHLARCALVPNRHSGLNCHPWQLPLAMGAETLPPS